MINVEIEELTPKVIGKKLGQDLYNSAGNVMLRQGVLLKPNYYNHLEKQGYRSVCLLNDDVIHLPLRCNFVSDQFLATAPFTLKEIFRMLWQDDNVRVAQAKGKLTALANSLLDHITFEVHRITPILDLKRQEDYLYQHCIIVAAYSVIVGERMGFDRTHLVGLAEAALLHDFGMLFIDEAIINKKTRLQEREVKIVQEHTTMGFKHLFNYGAFDGISALPSAQHHERFDGHGYPQSLSGDRIHEFSRIIALTDFFDAWTSDRPHRRLHSPQEAIEFVKENAGSVFDPKLARLLVDLFE